MANRLDIATMSRDEVELAIGLAQQPNYRRSAFRLAYSNIRFERLGALSAAPLDGIVDLADVPFGRIDALDRVFGVTTFELG